jgi:hypothetical protein
MNQTDDPRGDLLDETRVFWQARSPRQLSREDAREIIENLKGYFSVLSEWSRREEEVERGEEAQEG